MSFDEKKFVATVAKDKNLLNKLQKDPKTVLAQFNLKISDQQAQQIKVQFATMQQQGMRIEDILTKIARTKY